MMTDFGKNCRANPLKREVRNQGNKWEEEPNHQKKVQDQMKIKKKPAPENFTKLNGDQKMNEEQKD